MALSPDGKWAVTEPIDKQPAQLMLVPTGAGESRPLTNDAINHFLGARFTPDGQSLVFAGFEPKKPPRAWIQSLAGGPAKPITPEGFLGGEVSPDGQRMLGRTTDGKFFTVPLSGGAVEPIKGLQSDEVALKFTTDSRSLWIRRTLVDSTVQISRLDLASGVKTPSRQLTPLPETLGMGGIREILITPDGRGYVYAYSVNLAEVYLVRGLR